MRRRALTIFKPFRAFLIVLPALLPIAAFAGDAAYPVALGFSADGKHFAFAEWGRQDGSGFAYASVFFIDLENDKWMAAPIHDVILDEAASPRSAFVTALNAAEPVLAKAEITHPARLVFARNPVTPNGDHPPDDISWLPITMSWGDIKQHQIELETFELENADCDDLAFEKTQGFALFWDGQEIYRDKSLSQSRGCPTLYSVERVYMPDSVFPATFGVALIGFYRYGFEGADLRHIAVPIPLKP